MPVMGWLKNETSSANGGADPRLARLSPEAIAPNGQRHCRIDRQALRRGGNELINLAKPIQARKDLPSPAQATLAVWRSEAGWVNKFQPWANSASMVSLQGRPGGWVGGINA